MTTHAIHLHNSKPRRLMGLIPSGGQHWVGDGFHVSSVIHPQMDQSILSPFLLLDHAAPKSFGPAKKRRGVGEHPHRGFETVTFAYQGEVEHRDSAGGGGRIGPGDVQWMTAASGLVHEEMQSQKFTEKGGTFEMVQLWVNLRAAHKMDEPSYQGLLDADFPRVNLGAARARLVAGTLGEVQGPAKTRSPMTVFDLRFEAEGESKFEFPKGWTTLVYPLEGSLSLGPGKVALPSQTMAVFEANDEGYVQLYGQTSVRALVLAGEPLHESVAAHGPFVMNTQDELVKAFEDYRSGRMGRLG